MNASEILMAINAGEDKDWEFKSAKGGLPGSMWETYSAMSNSDGGVIVLGVRELGDIFEVHGLSEPEKMQSDFWTTINNRGKVSANLLANGDVRIVEVRGKSVLAVQVPRASRRQRPVFVGQNPLEGTFRRFDDGDYLCTREEVGRMLADQSDQPADSEILTRFQIADLDEVSLKQYRNRFASRLPTHPWLKLDDRELLERLGGWRRDRSLGHEGLTVAGLLMFGRDEVIRDPTAVPQYHIDYREHLSNAPGLRWTDRIWPDGTWTANLFQFFERVFPRLVVDIKIPFQFAALRPGETTTTSDPNLFQRHDETIIHEGIREALVNSLIHADFRGQGGILIQRYLNRLEFSNPGTLLLGLDQVFKGGISECRNKSLQLMFAMLGYGEKAGSGIDKIREGWVSQQWRSPSLSEQFRPDRVLLILPLVSLFPETALSKLRASLGDELVVLDAREVQALVMAEVEGAVTNERLQQFSTDHKADITRLLQNLVAKRLLTKDGYGRWATYQLSDRFGGQGLGPGGPDIAIASSRHTEAAPVVTGPPPDIEPEQDPSLLAIAEPARCQKRLEPEKMRDIIRRLCQGRYLTFRQLARLLEREPNGLQRWTLRPMAQEQQLVMAYPDKPNHPRQAYKTNPELGE